MGPTPRLRLAVTTGDPFGIGPEVTRAALEDPPEEVDLTVFGELDPARPDRPGPSAEGGRAALDALDAALAAIRAGTQDALVTAPLSKESCALADGPVDGHTPYLGRFFGVAAPLMSFAWDDDEPVVALLTHHIPLRAVCATLTSAKVEAAARRLDQALRRSWGLAEPRLGVLGVNPHAGEGGLLGTEEADFIAPAVERLRETGLAVDGPLPGDTAFAIRDRYDGLLAMYHDQGLAPVKALAFPRAVNITLGLPIVRTSPAHGTAFGMAGTGRADPTSMKEAVRWAARLARSALR